MSSDKKDLTRIEDLGEFIHELSQETEQSSDSDFPSELPDLPSSESDSLSFGGTDEVPAFGADSDEVSFPGTDEVENSAFATSSDSDPFGSQDSSLPEETSDAFSTTFSSEETPVPELSQEPTFSTDSFPSEDRSSEFAPATPEDKGPEAAPAGGADWDSSVFAAPAETATDAKPALEESYLPRPSEDPYKAPETFEDLKKFSESSSFSGMATEGNPSFSVLVKNVRFVEDVNDIVTILRELNLLGDSEEQTKSRLMRGTHLIPRISEFAAIYLGQKLRRFDVDLQIGLSDEIHPPKHHEAPELGIVSKHNLLQNQHHHFQFDEARLDLSQIIVAATPTLEGYQVVRYLGVASEHKMLDGALVEDENSSDVPKHYQELAVKLKAHALKAHSNAVVGLNYQLTPIPSEFGMTGTKYRLTCTGNLVWVNKL